MSTAHNEIISQKFNNYNYAPGIATYGIDGRTGESGNNGNNVFFTDCDIITTTEDLDILIGLIKNNKMPLKNTDITLIRKYQNGDIFFNRNGVVFKLIDIDKIIQDVKAASYAEFFEVCGKIDLDKIVDNQGRNIFNFSDQGRMVLNSSYYNGFDIIVGLTNNNVNVNEDAAVNIISNNVNQNDNIELVNMQCIDETDINDGKLSLYYKTTENAFHLDSEQPIIINGDLKLNNSNNTANEYDDYSTVLTSDDTITYFKHICDKLEYSIIYNNSSDGSENEGQYKLVIYSTEETEDEQRKTLEYIANRNETVFGKIYTQNNQEALVNLNYAELDVSGNLPYYERYNGIYNYSGIDISINNSSDCSVWWYKNDTQAQIKKINNSSINVSCNIDVSNYSIDASIYFNDVSIQYLDEEFHVNEVNIKTSLNLLPNIEIEQITKNENLYIIKYSADSPTYSDSSLYATGITSLNQQYTNTGICKFIFNPQNFNQNNKLINVKFYMPLYVSTIDYRQYIASLSIDLNNITLDDSKLYTLYFVINKSVDGVQVNHIKIFDNYNMDENPSSIGKLCIYADLPNEIDSIMKFSLLHNTEVFLRYNE